MTSFDGTRIAARRDRLLRGGGLLRRTARRWQHDTDREKCICFHEAPCFLSELSKQEQSLCLYSSSDVSQHP